MGKQTYSLLDFTSGEPLARPKCLNLLGKSKEKHNVIPVPAKINGYFSMGFKGPCWTLCGAGCQLNGEGRRRNESSKRDLTSLFLIYHHSKTRAQSTARHMLLDGSPPQPGALPAARAAG